MESHRTRESSQEIMKKNKKYVDGGQIFDTIGSLAPLLNMIPGVGQAAAPLVGLGASFLGNQYKKSHQNNNGSNPTGYTNSNAFGYADGGPVNPKFKGVNVARENTAIRPIGNNSTEAKLRALVSYHNTNAPTNENAKLADYYQSQLNNLNQNSQAYQKGLVSPEKIGSVIGNTALDLIPGKLGKALNFAKTAQGGPNELIPFNNVLQYIGELGGGNSSFKFAGGGSLQSLNSTSQIVTGAPNEIDGNQINYKGTNINLNHGETLDTNRDRVISDKYINPETGKRIIDEDKRLKSLRGKAEKIYQTTNDLAAKNTIKRTQEMEDNLYSIQENEAMKQGDRNSDGSTVQQGRRYKDGGNIDLQPKNNNADLIAQMQELVRQLNQPKALEQSTRPGDGSEFSNNVTWSQGGPQSETATNYPAFIPSATPGISSSTATNNGKPTEYIHSNSKVSTMADKPATKGRTANLELQRRLVELGYSNIGKAGIKNDIDGVIGNRTKAALREAIASGKLDKSYASILSQPTQKAKAAAPEGKVNPTIPSTGKRDAQSIVARRGAVSNENPYGFSTKIPYNAKNANTGLDQNGIAYDTDKSEAVHQLSDGKIVYKAPEYDGSGNGKVLKYLIPKEGGGYTSFKSLDEVKKFDRIKSGINSKLDQQQSNNNERASYIDSDIATRDRNINNYQAQIDSRSSKINELKAQAASKKKQQQYFGGLNHYQNYSENESIFNKSMRDRAAVVNEAENQGKSMDAKRKASHKFATGGSLKSYAPGGPLLSNQNPAYDQMGLNPLGQLNYGDTFTKTTDPLSLRPISGLSVKSNVPQANPTDLIKQYDQVNGTRPLGQSSSNMWSDMTMGEKVGLGSSALSVALKATDAFGKVQKEPYRYNNAAISLNQLDPTAILNNNQASYQSAMNDLNNNSSTGSNRAAIAANLFNNKLRANNDVMTKYGEQNSNLATQYEQRLAQRNSENNNMAYQVDDLNSKNRGAAQQMRSGVYADLSTLGLNQANVLNNRLSQNAQLEMLKQMAPDVYKTYMEKVKLK